MVNDLELPLCASKSIWRMGSFHIPDKKSAPCREHFLYHFSVWFRHHSCPSAFLFFPSFLFPLFPLPAGLPYRRLLIWLSPVCDVPHLLHPVLYNLCHLCCAGS